MDISDFSKSESHFGKSGASQVQSFRHLMVEMTGFIDHLQRIFFDLISRSDAIISNSDLIESNYSRLLSLSSQNPDQKRMISELHSLNEDNLRTIMKLRHQVTTLQGSPRENQTSRENVPRLNLDQHQDHHKSMTFNGPIPSEKIRANIDKDSFLSKKLQEAEQYIDKLERDLKEQKNINQQLDDEVVRRNQGYQKMSQELRQSREIEDDSKHQLECENQRLRNEYQKQIEDLNTQLDQKCTQIQDLVSELNEKDKLLRDNMTQKEGEYEQEKILDDNKRMYREITLVKDEANKYKLRINQLYNELDSYKATVASLESQNLRLKSLNDELNKTLDEERESNERGRDRVQDQMSRMSHKVNELEGVSESVESTKRDFMKKSDYLMQRLLDLKEYIV